MKKETRAKILKNTDKTIRYVNDEENGVMDTWLEEGIPDGYTDDDFMEYAEDEEMFNECCVLFSDLISSLIVKGEWDSKGHTVEFFNSNKVR